MATTAWSPLSWKDFPAAQQPDWPDPEAVRAVVEELTSQPPLVFAGEARNLLDRLAQVSAGEGVPPPGGGPPGGVPHPPPPQPRREAKGIPPKFPRPDHTAGPPPGQG